MLPCVGIHTSRKAFNQDDWYEDNKRVEIKRSWVLTIYMEKKTEILVGKSKRLSVWKESMGCDLRRCNFPSCLVFQLIWIFIYLFIYLASPN